MFYRISIWVINYELRFGKLLQMFPLPTQKPWPYALFPIAYAIVLIFVEGGEMSQMLFKSN